MEKWNTNFIKTIISEKKEIIEQIENINLRRVDFKKTDSRAYNLEACKNEAREILEILIKTQSKDNNLNQENQNNDFWFRLHPRVRQLAKTHFDNKLYADSVLTCLREINTIIKEYVRQAINQELDGAPLMTRAFSINNPIISFGDLNTENGRNIQLGYMKIFEGAMIGIRNPKSHTNLYPDESKAIHFLFLASFMFNKLQEAGIINEE